MISVFSIIILLSILGSCKKELRKETPTLPREKIVKIEQKYFGGFFSADDLLIVTRDSIKFTDREKKSVLVRNVDEDWKSLINSFQISDFRSVNSTPRVQQVDGIDQIIVVTTESRSDTLINGNPQEKSYRKIASFVQKLDSTYLKVKK